MSRKFLINTESHRRWILPDEDYAYDVVFTASKATVSIIHRLSGVVQETVEIDLTGKIGHQATNLLGVSEECAKRKYNLISYESRYGLTNRHVSGS